MSETKKMNCSAILEEGRCDKETVHPSGLCEQCRMNQEEVIGVAVLRCSQCTVSRTCPKAEQGPEGKCWFELYDDIMTLETKDKVQEMMRRVISSKYIIFKRLERLLTPNRIQDQESPVMSYYNKISKDLFDSVENFGKFMGYDVPKRSLKLEGKRIEILERIMTDKDFISDKDQIDKFLDEAKVIKKGEIIDVGESE